MQTFNPTGTAGLEVLFYLSGWWKWHILVGRCYYEWQSNGIKTEESDPSEKRSGRGAVKWSPQGEWELLTGSCRGGELHSESPEKERLLLQEKAGVKKWNSLEWKGNELETRTVYLHFLTTCILFSGHSRYFDISGECNSELFFKKLVSKKIK